MENHCEVLETLAARCSAGNFARDVLEGLSRWPKSIPSMYFYDEAGSRLFQQITELEEYYPTRCEQEILQAHAGQIAAAVSAVPFRLVELGAGDGRKTEILLQHFLDRGLDFEYVPIDICRQTILGLTHTLGGAARYQSLAVRGIVAEYFDGLVELRRRQARRNLVLFLGSNIGNFSAHQADRFLRTLRGSLNPGDYVLIGFDLMKDLPTLYRAYDDSAGVTRQFNLNLLRRINRELGGCFDCHGFQHRARFNAQAGCMESWLVSSRDQRVPIRALNRRFHFRAGDAIRVECSHKYHATQIESMAVRAGFSPRQEFFDRRRFFVDSLWQVG
jgi:dimethylhistidine N-methyltransferase